MSEQSLRLRIAQLEESEKQMQETVDLAMRTGARVTAERDALQERLNKSDQAADETMDAGEKVLAEAERLLARVAELEPDAARYRWLRNPDTRDGLEPEDCIVVGISEGEDIVWLEQLDQAIDAMIESTALNPTTEAASHVD